MEQMTKMKILNLSKRGNTFVVISMIITTVLAGSTVLAGTLIANNINNQQTISYQEAIDIASSVPEVAAFIEENDITSVSADLYEDVWIVEFYAGNVNYTEDFYCWLNYAYVEIDATTGEVLYYDVYSPSEPNFTESEIIDIANAIPEISAWLDVHEDACVFAWFDGYDSWIVDYYDEYYSAYVIISNIDGSVIYYDVYDPYEGAIHTPEEIIIIVEALPEVQNWTLENPDYEIYIYYSGTMYENYTAWDEPTEQIDCYCNTTDNVWFVDYWAIGTFPEYDWISIVVSDETEDILSIIQKKEAQLTETEVIAIAEAVPEVQAFIETLDSYEIYAWFDDYSGCWYVYINSLIYYQDYAYVEILDETAEVLYFEIYDEPDPQMTPEQIEAIANATPEVIAFRATFTISEESVSYWDGQWSFIILGGTGSPLVVTNGLEVIVDDATGIILEILEMMICY
jgi:hypothetical protein